MANDVRVHELGHSFGPSDEYGPDDPSTMRPDTRPLEITEDDALALGNPSNNRSGGQRSDTFTVRDAASVVLINRFPATWTTRSTS